MSGLRRCIDASPSNKPGMTKIQDLERSLRRNVVSDNTYRKRTVGTVPLGPDRGFHLVVHLEPISFVFQSYFRSSPGPCTGRFSILKGKRSVRAITLGGTLAGDEPSRSC